MWQVIGYGAIGLAVMLIVAAVPVGLMMCGFAADSGKLSKRRMVAVLSVVLLVVGVEVTLLFRWGWSLIH